METGTPALSGTLLLDRVGDVVVTLNSDGISWSAVDNLHYGCKYLQSDKDDNKNASLIFGFAYTPFRYGFYGDVIKESEKYRWMGPKRYDFVGTKVFLEHRSYEAEVTFLEDKMIDPNPKPEKIQCGPQRSLSSRKNPEKVFCRVNCTVCNKTEISSVDDERGITNASIQSEDSRWVRTKGRFLSVGAAVISCRNEKAPDGLVADAHLGDGFLHLILVKDCSRSYYLWHLTQLTRRGGNPLNFKFVEHHKTRAFTFMANHDESSWNLDGELLQGCQVTVRACRGLVNLFASGPEV
ncbi:uncharacterized protein A4U43_C04F32690 [Asparagus officinalis]|uniref:Ceramide kinase C-terminal domain-containing protein n=1 Tax=Asparagus officinalis TaxID=4686 RepID=A0A5P1FAJ8_ASPOF|nr:uncharacterized protein A4U43_C04F32690 [Asparagus officinalis]